MFANKLLILFLLYHTILNGHIWVSQIYPDYQNEQYVKTINFQISLENGLNENEILKIQLPFIVAIFNQVSIKQVGSATELVKAVYQENLSSEQSFLIKVAQDIQTNTWLNVVFTAFTGVSGSTMASSGFYQLNFQLSTYSGFDTSTNSVNGYLQYDYNYQAGQIEIAPPPIPMRNVTLITNKTNYLSLTLPKNTNTALADSYTIYIDLTPTSYYPEGVYYISMIDSNFQFKGTCTNIAHTCDVKDTNCVNITALEDNTWTCSISDNMITFDIKTEILKSKTLRLQTTVSNPTKYIQASTSNGIQVYLESRYAKYKFELFTLTSLFATAQLSVIIPTDVYFWGLQYSVAQTSGCPIGIYKSNTYLLWNKITILVGVPTSLPADTNGFIFYMLLSGIDMVSESSFKTTFTALTSKNIACTPTLAISSYFECKNIATVTSASNYSVSFAFVVMDAKTPADLTDFGKYNFKLQASNNQITITSSSLGIAAKKLFVNTEYVDSTWNYHEVFDTSLDSSMTLTQATQIITAANADHGRSLLKFDNTNLINLLIALKPTKQQKCCTSTDTEFCTSANSYCASVTGAALGTYASHIMLKMIINKNIFQSFSESDDTTDQGSLKLKGVDLLQLGGGWMGSISGHNCDTSGSISVDDSTTYCLSYTNYQTYLNVIDATKSYHLFYNFWATTTTENGAAYYELFWVCTSKLNNKNICGAVDESYTANTNVPIVMIKKVKFSTEYLGFSLYPNQKEFDLIICFRYSKEQSAANGFNVSQQFLASTSLVNVGTINWQQTSAPKTYMSMGVFNYYNPHENQGSNNLNYIVNLVRIQARFNSLDHSSSSAKLAVFFGADNMLSGGINPDGGLNISECVMVGSSSGLTCEYQKVTVLDTLVSSLTTKMLENPLSMSHLDFTANGLNSVASEINIYVPIVIGSSLIQYVMMGWLTDTNIGKLFKVFGLNEGTYGFVKSTKLGGTLLADHADNLINYNGIANWIVKDNGCSTSTAGYSQTTEIKPANSVNTAEIASEISSCTTVMKTLNSVTGEANSHFIVHSFKKFWTGSVAWGYTLSSAEYQTAACAELTIQTVKSSVTTPNTYYTAYMVVCPYEGTGSIPVSSSVKLKLNTWTFPSNYGPTAALGKHMRLIWTANDGSVQAYSTNIGVSTLKLSGCVLSAVSSVVQNAYFQQTQFTVTPDLPMSLTTNFPLFKVKLTLGAMQFTLATTKCMVNITNVTCSVTTDSSNLMFIMTNIGSTTVTIPKDTAIQCSFWVKYTSSASTTTYTGEIHMIFDDNLRANPQTGTEVAVSSCSSNIAWGVGSPQSYTLTMTAPVFSLRAGARSPFSFTFTSDRAFLDVGFFVFDLGFLGTETNLASDNKNNLRCALFKNDVISHDFSKFSITNLSKVEIYYKEVSQTAVTSLSTLTYKFQCYGAKSITQAPGSTEKLSVIYRVSAVDVGSVNSGDLSSSYSTLRILNSGETTITLSKEFQYVGQEANYIFNIKPQQSTTAGTTLFQAGSKIVIEFPSNISPKLNKLGAFECLQESKQLECIIDFERRVIATIISDLDPTYTYGHNITIVGVEQPASFSTFYQNIFVGLVPKDQSNNIDFEVMKDGGSLSDSTQDNFVTKNIPVLYFKQSGSLLRSTFSFIMDIQLSASTVKADVPLYIDFPGEFEEAFFLKVTPICSLKNVIYGSNTIHQFASNCEFVNTRRIKITLLDDNDNTEEMRYQLVISNLQTPNYQISHPFQPVVWHGNSSHKQLPLYKSNLGNFNGTYSTYSYENNKELLIHDLQENYFEAYIGVYKNSIKFSQNSGKNFFDKLEILKMGADYNKFSYYPASFVIPQATNSISLKLAGMQSSNGGRYQIQFLHESKLYTQFPPINVMLTTNKCQVQPVVTSFDVPDGGYSLPILIDFTTCIPIQDVEVSGTITTSSQPSKYFKFASSQDKKTFTFDEDDLQKYVAFKVSGARDTLSDDEPANPKGEIAFTFGGSNGNSFSIKEIVSLQIVDGTTDKPELYINDINSDTPGQQKFEFISTKSGTIFFACSQNKTAISEITYAKMYAKTEGVGKTLTNIVDNVIYGYIEATNSQNSTFPKTISGLFESEAKYSIKAVAMDQMGFLSGYVTKNWTQVSNQGKPVMIGLFFKQNTTDISNSTVTGNASLSETQALDVACSISKMLGLSKKQVFTQYGKSCFEKDTIYKPSTQTTNSSTLRDLAFWPMLRMLESNITNEYEYFIVLPDYYKSDGDQYQFIKSKTTESGTFKTELLSDSKINFDIVDIRLIVNENTAVVPVLSSPTLKIVETEAQFTFTITNTNGFVFVGVYDSKLIVNLTQSQLKGSTSFDFSGYQQTFCFLEKSQTVAISSLSKGTYTYSYLATNENMNTLTYTTGVIAGTTFKIEDPSAVFGNKLSLNIFLLALFILMLILN